MEPHIDVLKVSADEMLGRDGVDCAPVFEGRVRWKRDSRGKAREEEGWLLPDDGERKGRLIFRKNA